MANKSKGISLEDLETNSMTAEQIQPDVVPEPQTIVEQQETVIEPEPVAEVEPQVQEPVVEPAPVETPFDVTFFGKNYESLDQVKADLEKPTMVSEYQELEAKYKDLNENLELLIEQTDPSSFFSTEALKLEVFKKANPKKDASVAQKVFSTEDLSSIDDLEMVKMGRKFKNSKLPGTDADLEAAIMEELNIDAGTPKSEWPNTAQIRLATIAGEYRDAFDQLKISVSLPEKVNIDELKSKRKEAQEQKIATLNEGWSKVAAESLQQTTKIKLPIGTPEEGQEQKFFEWDLRGAPKEEVEQIKKEYIQLGLDPGGDAKDSFQETLDITLLKQNLPQIMKAYADDALARQKEEFLEKTHNPEPLTDSQRPEISSDEELKKERTAFALGGLGSPVHGKRLF